MRVLQPLYSSHGRGWLYICETRNSVAYRITTEVTIKGEVVGDTLSSSGGSALVHSCNTAASWGAGVASRFKENYPEAYDVYRSYCLSCDSSRLAGTRLLVEPVKPTYIKYWVACLFTSRGSDMNTDGPLVIARDTELSTLGLASKLTELESHLRGTSFGECFSVRISSGLFHVQWNITKVIIATPTLEVTVVSRPIGESSTPSS